MKPCSSPNKKNKLFAFITDISANGDINLLSHLSQKIKKVFGAYSLKINRTVSLESANINIGFIHSKVSHFPLRRFRFLSKW